MLDYVAIGRKIAFYRKRAYFTQETLAESLGISESYISQVERGKAEISLKRLNHIAETVNVDITLLLADSNPKFNNYGCTEFIEVIRNWTPEQKELLLNLIKCADDQFASVDRKKK